MSEIKADPTENESEIQSVDRPESIVDDDVQIQSRSMTDPPLSDIDFKNKWLESELPLTKFIRAFNSEVIFSLMIAIKKYW